jgi:hypothetical protein
VVNRRGGSSIGQRGNALKTMQDGHVQVVKTIISTAVLTGELRDRS